jgi:hypothetical protein
MKRTADAHLIGDLYQDGFTATEIARDKTTCAHVCFSAACFHYASTVGAPTQKKPREREASVCVVNPGRFIGYILMTSGRQFAIVIFSENSTGVRFPKAECGLCQL